MSARRVGAGPNADGSTVPQTGAMLAILGGVGAALCWATSSMASARSARRIGAWSTVAWVMLIGTAIAVPATFAVGGGATFTSTVVMLLVISGVSNVVGLVLVYTASGA